MNVTLSSAIRRTVAEILNISEKSISIPIISPKRRMLLSGVYVTYDLNVTSYRTPEWYKSALTESVEKPLASQLECWMAYLKEKRMEGIVV